MQEAFKEIIEELEVESEWTRTHGADQSFKQGRLSGLATAKRVIERIAKQYREKELSEWCHDCKEYDKEKHHCPRFCKVIRSTIEEMKQAHKNKRETKTDIEVSAMSKQEALKVLEMFLDKQCDLERTAFAYTQREVWQAIKAACEALEKSIITMDDGK